MMDALHRLSAADLATLASALRTGRLAPPYTEVAVKRHCGGEVAGELTRGFERLAQDGMQPTHLAYMLDVCAETRRRQPTASDAVELVWTGPETLDVANRDTGVVVRELFRSATSEVLVAGFAIYQGRDVFRVLAEQMDRLPGLRVQFFIDIRRPLGDSTAASELVWRFANRFRSSEWPGNRLPELYYDPRSLDDQPERRSSLHAKCVVIDRRWALVTSANFTEAAQIRNIEVGALVKSADFASTLAGHFHLLAAAHVLVRAPDAGPRPPA